MAPPVYNNNSTRVDSCQWKLTANCEFVDFPACVVADCLAKESLNKSEELIIA